MHSSLFHMYFPCRIRAGDRGHWVTNLRSLGKITAILPPPLKSWFEGPRTTRRVLSCYLTVPALCVSREWRKQQTTWLCFLSILSVSHSCLPWPWVSWWEQSENVWVGRPGQRCQRQRAQGMDWGLNQGNWDCKRTSESFKPAVGGDA